MSNFDQQAIIVTNRITAWTGSISSLVVHTCLFAAAFAAIGFGVQSDKVMLLLTTIVSLEAIYLAIFIQMSVNRNTADISEIQGDIEEIGENLEDIADDVDEIADDVEKIEHDIDEIQEDVEGIEKDVAEIGDDVDEIAADVENIEKDIDEIQADVEGIEKDVDEIATDVDDIGESMDDATKIDPTLSESQSFILQSLLTEIRELRSEVSQLRNQK